MRPKLVDRVELPTELFFADERVDRAVAVGAQQRPSAHLLTREALLKPFVLVNGDGNEVVKGEPSLSSTQLAVADS